MGKILRADFDYRRVIEIPPRLKLRMLDAQDHKAASRYACIPVVGIIAAIVAFKSLRNAGYLGEPRAANHIAMGFMAGVAVSLAVYDYHAMRRTVRPLKEVVDEYNRSSEWREVEE